MLEKTYEPKNIEAKWAKAWQQRRLFMPPADREHAYTIVIPPPNITGALHMGHALNNTLQDILVRSHRMFGSDAYWVPGTDHGGIATQSVLEKKLAKEQKLRRHDLGREKFLAMTWQWYKECGNTILEQLQQLGCALDLSSENVRFTMDEKRAKSVFEAFRLLWDKKLVYRGERMINWCVHCGTALSDIEVEHETSHSKLWHIRYLGADGSDGVIVATTRPETLFGDTAVAVNPEDERYKNLVGKQVRLPLTDRLIPVIADQEVDSSFGTGALKITPAHDPVDHEIGKRHKLANLVVLTHEGKMQNVPKKYLGLDRSACRHAVQEDLREQGLLIKEEPYAHAVSSCYRCNQPIEPYISEQWFVSMKGLAKPAIAAAKSGKIAFHPESWQKPYLDWLEKIEDWCISRQIWWGHRVPVWYCENCSAGGLYFAETADGSKELSRVSFKNGAKPIVSFEKPAKCPTCGHTGLLQDPDVLDTWFSSGLWPFSVFGWPEKTPELKKYYPTSVLSTGYEILYLWVARMVMMGLEFMGDIPFSHVYLHGIVRDKRGKKMSKSLGNVIDPRELMPKYGTDALRFSLASQAAPGRDIPFDEESIIGARNFCNKIYNASRFVLMNLPENAGELKLPPPERRTLADRWILDRYCAAVETARAQIEDYNLSAAASTLYAFLWDEYCDWYIELSKSRLQQADKQDVLAILTHVLRGTLRALHPFMPYITEELAAQFKNCAGAKADFLLMESYPKSEPALRDPQAVREMETVMGVTSAIRTMRSHFCVPPAAQIKAVVSSAGNKEELQALNSHAAYVKLLAKLETLETGVEVSKPSQSATGLFRDMSVYLPLAGLIDFGKEKARLAKEKEKLQREAQQCEQRLGNPDFKAHAPAEEVAKIQARLEQAQLKIKSVDSSLQDLS
ncbi:MAG TPA: valine--tRNA ligase [Elusimicrobiales bacterium]|nr:valine--tRNA ligase [Elusimicrobiales bacterium]